MANINTDSLRDEKINEFRQELRKMIIAGEKYGITAADLIEVLDELKGV